MSKGYQINKEEGTIIVNIKNVDRIYNGSVHFMGNKVLTDLSDADIEGITEMVEQYTGGISPEIVEELEAQIAQLNVQIDNLNTEISSLETENTELIAQRDALIVERNTLVEQVGELNAQVETLNSQISVLNTQIEELNTQKAQLEAQVSELQAQVAQLEQEVVDAYNRGYAEGYEDGSHPFKGLCFTAEEAGSTVRRYELGSYKNWYSYNGKDWNEYNREVITLTNVGDKVYWKGNGINPYDGYNTRVFELTGKVAASGSIMSLIDGTGESKTIPYGQSFRYLFAQNKTSLTKAPELTATTLTKSCYSFMFFGCQSLTTAPELPATSLADSCYYHMFEGCSSLTQAPLLNATTLARSCYQGMFNSCSSLVNLQQYVLPATTLANSCYAEMFRSCSSFIQAPELPTTTLVPGCYFQMFCGCSKLNYIKVGASSWNESYTSSFTYGVSSYGKFVKPKGINIPTGTSGIPENWTIQEYETDYTNGYDDGYEDGSKGPFKGLCFTAEQAGSTIVQNYGKDGCTYSTSTDGISWQPYTLGTIITLTNIGDKVYWKGNGISNPGYKAIFTMKGKIAASGSVMSLIDEVGESLVIPTGNDFKYLFYNCAILTQAPELPATTLSSACYSNMFSNCTILSTAPELPATTLTEYCYSYMFDWCTSLKQAPELPATTLTSNCYSNMFKNCYSLTTAPELPATTLVYYCYDGMFIGCSKLNYIKVGATSWNTTFAYNWVYNISSTGTFVKPKDTEITAGINGIPRGWTVEIDGTYTEGYNDGYADGSAINTIIVDEDASNVWSGTLEEYQALTPADNIIYLIHE